MESGYDLVRVFFEDGTSTVTHVHQDECIKDAIVELCEEKGWGLLDVVDYCIEETDAE